MQRKTPTPAEKLMDDLSAFKEADANNPQIFEALLVIEENIKKFLAIFKDPNINEALYQKTLEQVLDEIENKVGDIEDKKGIDAVTSQKLQDALVEFFQGVEKLINSNQPVAEEPSVRSMMAAGAERVRRSMSDDEEEEITNEEVNDWDNWGAAADAPLEAPQAGDDTPNDVPVPLKPGAKKSPSTPLLRASANAGRKPATDDSLEDDLTDFDDAEDFNIADALNDAEEIEYLDEEPPTVAETPVSPIPESETEEANEQLDAAFGEIENIVANFDKLDDVEPIPQKLNDQPNRDGYNRAVKKAPSPTTIKTPKTEYESAEQLLRATATAATAAAPVVTPPTPTVAPRAPVVTSPTPVATPQAPVAAPATRLATPMTTPKPPANDYNQIIRDLVVKRDKLYAELIKNQHTTLFGSAKHINKANRQIIQTLDKQIHLLKILPYSPQLKSRLDDIEKNFAHALNTKNIQKISKLLESFSEDCNAAINLISEQKLYGNVYYTAASKVYEYLPTKDEKENFNLHANDFNLGNSTAPLGSLDTTNVNDNVDRNLLENKIRISTVVTENNTFAYAETIKNNVASSTLHHIPEDFSNKGIWDKLCNNINDNTRNTFGMSENLTTETFKDLFDALQRRIQKNGFQQTNLEKEIISLFKENAIDEQMNHPNRFAKHLATSFTKIYENANLQEKANHGFRAPSNALIRLAQSQLNNLIELKPNETIRLNTAPSEEFVRAILLYAKVHKIDVVNNTPYRVDPSKKEIHAFELFLRTNKLDFGGQQERALSDVTNIVNPPSKPTKR